ncbi:hypothetical protein BHM03_00055236 [Ensete ventricosum]|nr:hypothetical protein BHM03_00055236 [Ensete ventricosum]
MLSACRGGWPRLDPLQGWPAMAKPLARATTHGQAGCDQSSLQGGGWMPTYGHPRAHRLRPAHRRSLREVAAHRWPPAGVAAARGHGWLRLARTGGSRPQAQSLAVLRLQRQPAVGRP